ncbi:MAG TPA: phage/plasmid primase, P4 family [Bryobacteraceae bacterium]|nr:phage/plasmid primase, P4 family [Bryobacteraceae bacterium]
MTNTNQVSLETACRPWHEVPLAEVFQSHETPFQDYDPLFKLQVLLVDRWLECLPHNPSPRDLFFALQDLGRFEASGDEGSPGDIGSVAYWLFVLLHLVDDYIDDLPTPVDAEAAAIVREGLNWVAEHPSEAPEDDLALARRLAMETCEGEAQSGHAVDPHGALTPAQTQMTLRIFQCTDTGNAERLVNRHGADIRYCHQQRTWYWWDSARWVPDQVGHMMRLAKGIARALHAEAARLVDDAQLKKYAAWALASESTERKKKALESAQSEPGVPILPGDFDRDPFLLNCLSGTISLRTGELRQHRREDLITKLAPVRFAPGARSGLWEWFLQEATGGDQDFQEFLQRAIGYSLTGDVSEEKLFFVHGPGASGKSTFLEAIKAALGDYAKTADFETFVQRNAGGIRDDIAELAGRRFVVSIEVDEGKKLAEGLTKCLTGGDTVRARFLYQGAFDFVPQFKLWLAANHEPNVKHSDTAMWRRILRIPFDHVVPKEKRDRALKARLKDVRELGPAILAWAVEGCLRWQEDGLGVPSVVEDATEQYRMDMDPLKDFLADCCVLAPGIWGTAKDLRQAYEAHCRDHGEKRPLTAKEFAACLRARGCESDHRRAGNVWVGIGLRADDATGGVM